MWMILWAYVGETWLNNMTEYLYGKTPKVCKNKYVKIAC